MSRTWQPQGLESRIAKLLGSGIDQERVASAVGVDASYVSQLMADDAFRLHVQEIKLLNLEDNTKRDKRYDGLEDKLLNVIERDIDSNPLAFKNTMDKTRALVMINGLKRRGAQADPNIANINQTIVKLVLPMQLSLNYIKDSNNQVVKAGGQDLITMQSGNMEAASSGNSDGDNDEYSIRQGNKRIQFYE